MGAVDAAAHGSLEAETAVIGSILIQPDILPKLLAQAESRDFTSKPAQLAFNAARSLFQDGKSVNAFAVRNIMGEQYSQYLADCIDMTPSALTWPEYLSAMHEQAVLGRIRAEAMKLTGAQTLAECREAVAHLGEEFGAGKRVESWTLAELLQDFVDRVDRDKPREYVTFGIGPLDEGTYTERGDVVMIGGSPSDGKTAFALCTALHMAKRYNVGFFSLETGKEKLEDRLVASGFEIDMTAIKRHTMTEADWLRFSQNSDAMSALRLRIFRASGMTVEQIAATARAYALDVVFIDYVQLVEVEAAKNETRASQMASVSRALHTFAQTSGTLVIELAQLTRQEQQRQSWSKKGEPPPPDRERNMFDLAESSQFEKDADLILLLYRPGKNTHFVEDDKYSETLDAKKTRILRVAKNKEGVWGRWPLAFDGAHQRFSVLAENSFVAVQRAVREAEQARREAAAQLRFDELGDEAEQDMPF